MNSITIAIICPEIISLSYADEITVIKNKIELLGGFPAVYVYDFDYNKSLLSRNERIYEEKALCLLDCSSDFQN